MALNPKTPGILHNPKLSFVANSGVKIGSTLGASEGAYEINILDVDSMVDMVVGGMATFAKNGAVGMQDSGRIEKIPLPAFIANAFNPPKTVFADEHLNTLMHGVGYGKDYSIMSYYKSNPGNFSVQTWQRYHQTLGNNKARSGQSNSMTIQLASVELVVNLNGESYRDSNFNSKGDGYLYLQSHWGSGVIFTSASLQINS